MNIVWKGAAAANFLKGRQGKKPDKIICHWFGAGTLESANTRFQNGANQVSAHYGVSDDRVWQWVKEEDTAYGAGNFTANLTAVQIEHDANPSKPASEATYDASAKLIRDIRSRWGDLPLRKHNEFKATACPGTLDLARLDALARQTEDNNMKFILYREKPTGKIYFKIWEGRLVYVPSPNELTFYFGEAPAYQEVDDIHSVGVPVEEVFTERDVLSAGVLDLRNKLAEAEKNHAEQFAALSAELILLKDNLLTCQSQPPKEIIKVEIKEVPVPETSLSMGRLFELLVSKIFSRG